MPQRLHTSDEDSESSGDTPWDLVSTPARSSRTAAPLDADPVTIRLRERMASGLTKNDAATELLTECSSSADVHQLLMMATQAGAHGV